MTDMFLLYKCWNLICFGFDKKQRKMSKYQDFDFITFAENAIETSLTLNFFRLSWMSGDEFHCFYQHRIELTQNKLKFTSEAEFSRYFSKALYPLGRNEENGTQEKRTREEINVISAVNV